MRDYIEKKFGFRTGIEKNQIKDAQKVSHVRPRQVHLEDVDSSFLTLNMHIPKSYIPKP